jgi:hypothetical protein
MVRRQPVEGAEMRNRIGLTICLLSAWASPAFSQTAVPATIAAAGETIVLSVHAEGAQVYECKATAGSAPSWVFREPIATLLRDGQTIGRHYAGPTWELTDTSVVVGKVVAKAAGAAPGDIPLLKLAAAEHRGTGALSGVTTIQRLHTIGGVLQGACSDPAATRSVAYSADYVFLKK